MKSIRIFRHVVCGPPGYLGKMLEQRGYPSEVICLDEGVSVPMDLEQVAGLVLMGGPGNVADPTPWMQQELELIREAARRGIPVLGICLGAQLISKALGGEVMPGSTLEAGWHEVHWFTDHPSARSWFAGLPPRFPVFQWHAHTYSLPPGATSLAYSDCIDQQAFAMGNILALQFHLEILPESVRNIIARFPGDLEQESDCVQSASRITANLEEKTRALHRLADVVFGRWLDRLGKKD